MAAFSLCSSSNLTLRQIRLCISGKKGGAISLAVSHFSHLTIGKQLRHTGCNLLLREHTNLDYCTHLWDTIV